MPKTFRVILPDGCGEATKRSSKALAWAVIWAEGTVGTWYVHSWHETHRSARRFFTRAQHQLRTYGGDTKIVPVEEVQGENDGSTDC